MRNQILKHFSFLFTLILISCGGGGGDDTGGGGGGGCSAGGGGGVDVGHWFVGSPGLASGGGERWCRAA